MNNLIKNFGQFINESSNHMHSHHEELSSCCGAEILKGGFCSDCGEHCVPEEEGYTEYPEDQVQNHEFEPHNHEEVYEGKKASRKEVLKYADEKYPNLKKSSMKKGLKHMKGKDFKEKAEKNFGWADKPEAAAAAYIRKATGKEPRDV
jgi:hypothetical protein